MTDADLYATPAPTSIVAHDLSSFAEQAADTALDDVIDSRRRGRLLIVHVLETPSPESGLTAAEAAFVEEAQVRAERSLEHIRERLRRRVRLLGAEPSSVEVEAVLLFGPRAERVIEEASIRQASRIYVGTHGRSGLKRLVVGSVAERIAQHALIPVVVVHGDRASAPPRDAAVQ